MNAPSPPKKSRHRRSRCSRLEIPETRQHPRFVSGHLAAARALATRQLRKTPRGRLARAGRLLPPSPGECPRRATDRASSTNRTANPAHNVSTTKALTFLPPAKSPSGQDRRGHQPTPGRHERHGCNPIGLPPVAYGERCARQHGCRQRQPGVRFQSCSNLRICVHTGPCDENTFCQFSLYLRTRNDSKFFVDGAAADSMIPGLMCSADSSCLRFLRIPRRRWKRIGRTLQVAIRRSAAVWRAERAASRAGV